MTNAETSRRKLTATTLGGVLVIIVCLGVVGYGITKIRETSQENTKSRIALCEIRADHQRSIIRLNRLLAENPGDIFGIPREIIISSRDDDRQTIDALRILDCS